MRYISQGTIREITMARKRRRHQGVVVTKISTRLRVRKGPGLTIRTVSSDGQNSMFEFSQDDGKVRYKITGRSPQNEEWLLPCRLHTDSLPGQGGRALEYTPASWAVGWRR